MSIPREFVMIHADTIWGEIKKNRLLSGCTIVFYSLMYWIDDDYNLTNGSIEKLAKEDHMKARKWNARKIKSFLIRLEEAGFFKKTSPNTWQFLRPDILKFDE